MAQNPIIPAPTQYPDAMSRWDVHVAVQTRIATQPSIIHAYKNPHWPGWIRNIDIFDRLCIQPSARYSATDILFAYEMADMHAYAQELNIARGDGVAVWQNIPTREELAICRFWLEEPERLWMTYNLWYNHTRSTWNSDAEVNSPASANPRFPNLHGNQNPTYPGPSFLAPPADPPIPGNTQPTMDQLRTWATPGRIIVGTAVSRAPTGFGQRYAVEARVDRDGKLECLYTDRDERLAEVPLHRQNRYATPGRAVARGKVTLYPCFHSLLRPRILVPNEQELRELREWVVVQRSEVFPFESLLAIEEQRAEDKKKSRARNPLKNRRSTQWQG